jgi:hypothetical protein
VASQKVLFYFNLILEQFFQDFAYVEFDAMEGAYNSVDDHDPPQFLNPVTNEMFIIK